MPEGIKPFYLFEDKDGEPRKIHVVYSGGDDLFLVGAWDDLMGFAVDLKRVFSVYTNGKLTFSAGLGLYSSTYPISRMAEVTGELEELAKNSPGKIASLYLAVVRNIIEMKRIAVQRKKKMPLFIHGMNS